MADDKSESTERFPARIVLGEGWPWVSSEYGDVALTPERTFELKWKTKRVDLAKGPDVHDPDCPRYRLVLERVEG